MSSFTTRVELHNAYEEDYTTLHLSMLKKGFQRTVVGSKSGTEFHLPTAEYTITGNYTAGGVLEAAKSAASTTGRKYGVLVTESLGLTFVGLKEV